MVDTRLGKRVGPQDPAQVMGFELHSPDFPVPLDVVSYTHAKLVAKLAKCGSDVLEVIVHFKDVNAGKGGEDKACHMEARLAGHGPVNVEERNHDLRAVIDLSVERLAEAVQRHLDRTGGKQRAQERKIVRPRKLGV